MDVQVWVHFLFQVIMMVSSAACRLKGFASSCNLKMLFARTTASSFLCHRQTDKLLVIWLLSVVPLLGLVPMECCVHLELLTERESPIGHSSLKALT